MTSIIPAVRNSPRQRRSRPRMDGVALASLLSLFVLFVGASALAQKPARHSDDDVASIRTRARCATMHELSRRRAVSLSDGPSNSGPTNMVFAQSRPESFGFTDSDVRPLRVHWQAVAFESEASQVMALVEDAWTEQVDVQGYRAPLADEGEGGDARLDVYIVNTPGIAGLTLASADVDNEDGAHAAYVHLLVNVLLSEDERAVTVHHEFAHAIQFATDRSESLMFFEASAVWQEVHALPASTLWIDNVSDFQSNANAPFFTDGITWRSVLFEDTLYEYGAVLFLMYLEETLGENDGVLLRTLWDASVQGDDVDENEPDWLDGLYARSDFDRDQEIAAFAMWRFLVGVWEKDGEGPTLSSTLNIRDEVVTRRLLPAALDGRPIDFLRSEFPFPTGCAWASTTAPGNRAMEVDFDIESLRDEGEQRELAVVAIRGFPPSDALEILAPTFGAEHAFTINLDEGETIAFGVCDLTLADGDALGAGHPISVIAFDTSLERPVVDAGVELDAGSIIDAGGEPEPPVVCGCQTSRRPGLPGGGPWGAIRPYLYLGGILLGGYMTFVRFRRSARGRKSIQGTSWKEQRDASVEKTKKGETA